MVCLSKSNYLLGLQCPLLLWTKFNEPDKIPQPDASAQARFDTGHLIGALSKKLFPDGIDIPDDNIAENLENTKKLLEKRKPLFEPALSTNNLYSRADILVPVDEDEWDIYEVKSSTKVKEVYLDDVAFQRHVYQLANLKIRKSFLVHINNQYVKNGEIEPEKFFSIVDISEEVKQKSYGIEKRIEYMFKIIQGEKPTKQISESCHAPYSCSLKEICWAHLPDDNVFNLYYGNHAAFWLHDHKIFEISKIPDGFKLTDVQLIQKKCSKKKTHHIEKENIKSFLKNLKYPLYFLDFETINPAVPKFDGMRPYQRIPFQFSLHIQHEDGKIEHKKFLCRNREDPRREFIETLKKFLDNDGDIIVYNENFERYVLKELVSAFPEFTNWHRQIEKRIVDLLEVFRNFDYYHYKQNGSVSLKKVLPVLSDLSYKDLEIGNGADASLQYELATFGEITDDERQKIYDALDKYCYQDTLAEIKIIEGLKKLVE